MEAMHNKLCHICDLRERIRGKVHYPTPYLLIPIAYIKTRVGSSTPWKGLQELLPISIPICKMALAKIDR